VYARVLCLCYPSMVSLVCMCVCVTADFHASPERRIFFGWDPILMRKDTHTPRSFSYSSCLALRNKKKMKNNFCFLLTPLIRMYPPHQKEKKHCTALKLLLLLSIFLPPVPAVFPIFWPIYLSERVFSPSGCIFTACCIISFDLSV